MMRYKAKVAACVLPLLLAFAGCSQNPQANGASEWADTPAAADKPSVLGQIFEQPAGNCARRDGAGSRAQPDYF